MKQGFGFGRPHMKSIIEKTSKINEKLTLKKKNYDSTCKPSTTAYDCRRNIENNSDCYFNLNEHKKQRVNDFRFSSADVSPRERARRNNHEGISLDN